MFFCSTNFPVCGTSMSIGRLDRLYDLRGMLFCSTNFPVLRRTRPDAKCIVAQERCVFRNISSNTAAYSQKLRPS